MTPIRSLLSLLLLLLPLPCAQADQRLVDSTIVVYNSNLPESAALAKFYAQKRGIARDHLVGLDCSSEEEITRDQYDETIADPLRKIFKERGWWTVRGSGDGVSVTGSSVRIMALIKGMPLKIRAIADYPGNKPGPGPIGDRNEASVILNWLCSRPVCRQISGVAPNPYFQSFRPIADFENDPALARVPVGCAERVDGPADGCRCHRDREERPYGDAHMSMARTMSSPGWPWRFFSRSEIVKQCRRTEHSVVSDDTPEIFPKPFR